METIDKHAPIRIKRVGKKNSPWVTGELRRLLFERDSLKKRAAKSGDASLWHQYKQFRNCANNEMKRAKRLYFTNNLELHKHDMKKTWKLINDLNSRHCRTSSYIKEVKIDDQIVNSPNQMAETFNTYFSNVGSNLSDEIPSSVDSNPEDYLDPTDGTFSLQFPSVNTVTRLLKTIDEKKSASLDNIPNKLLKIAAEVVWKNWKNSKLCENTPPCGRCVSTQLLVFPISTCVDITVYQHGKCFIFLKYNICSFTFSHSWLLLQERAYELWTPKPPGF